MKWDHFSMTSHEITHNERHKNEKKLVLFYTGIYNSGCINDRLINFKKKSYYYSFVHSITRI
jgi:hypothetical protein